VGAVPLGVRSGFHPSAGLALLAIHDLLRMEVARGFGRGGVWTFNVDVARGFWSVL
jgi:hypothetical protein